MRSLNVFREYRGAFELVGSLAAEASRDPRFVYSPSYRKSLHAVPIAPSLPLSEQGFSSENPRAFFDGLIPEGPMREAFERAARADKDDYLAVLDSVRNEPIEHWFFPMRMTLCFLREDTSRCPRMIFKDLPQRLQRLPLHIHLRAVNRLRVRNRRSVCTLKRIMEHGFYRRVRHRARIS